MVEEAVTMHVTIAGAVDIIFMIIFMYAYLSV